MAIFNFESNLETNLLHLCADLNGNKYRHGPYNHKIINEKKRRDIAVACVRDRVVHRLLYDYLVPLTDKKLDFDVWSCRPRKGLHEALRRTQRLAAKYEDAWVWRADITKFFDHVDHETLQVCLSRLVSDGRALNLLAEVVVSYGPLGIPIGNLTSQIFANIYLHEFDRYARHQLQPLAYVRYGDDFLLFFNNRLEAVTTQQSAARWLAGELKLQIHAKNNIVVRSRHGLHFLGHIIYPDQLPRIDKTMSRKIDYRLSSRTFASYHSMYLSHKQAKQLPWLLHDQLQNDDNPVLPGF